jgi:hypothetical protein
MIWVYTLALEVPIHRNEQSKQNTYLIMAKDLTVRPSSKESSFLRDHSSGCKLLITLLKKVGARFFYPNKIDYI